MYTTSTSTAQQFAADRHAAYEGVATRRRLRKLARRGARAAANEAVRVSHPTARIVAPRVTSAPQPAVQKPVSRKVA